jgi:hypothetical protein
MRYALLLLFLLCASPVAAQSGFLQVFVTQDGIEITVGNTGSVIATSAKPIDYRLPPGSYGILARKAGFEDLVQTVKIRSDELTKVRFTLAEVKPQERQLRGIEAGLLSAKTGDLKILSMPADSRVLIDGKERRLRTPMEIKGVPIGYYKVNTAGCEILAAVRENTITRIECVNGAVTESYSQMDASTTPVDTPDAYREDDPNVVLDNLSDRMPDTTPSRIQNTVQGTSRQGGFSSNINLRKGFKVSAGIGALLASGGGGTEIGPGVHGTLGYGLSERFTIGLIGAAGSVPDKEADGSAIATVGGVFGRMYFRAPEKSIRPYFLLGAGQGLYQADFTGTTVSATGLAGTVGIGVDRVSQGKLGYYLELDYSAINFTKLSFEGKSLTGLDINFDYLVLAIGLRLRF